MYHFPNQSDQEAKAENEKDKQSNIFTTTTKQSFWRLSDKDISAIRSTLNNAPTIVLGGGGAVNSHQSLYESDKRYK